MANTGCWPLRFAWYNKSMPYRPIPFVAGEYFHLINRGNLKCNIFKDDTDRARFLLYLIYFQSSKSIYKPGRRVSKFLKTGDFDFDEAEVEKILSNRTVKIIAFSLMPNHFHILIQSSIDNGVSIYMQKVLNAYTKYFNTRYKQSGHLFSGPFRAVHVESNEQLLYTSAYIHLNPRELFDFSHKSGQHRVLATLNYRWSSFSDFVNQNRWKYLLDPRIILDQIEGLGKGRDYQKWVEESGAKEKEPDKEVNLFPLDFE